VEKRLKNARHVPGGAEGNDADVRNWAKEGCGGGAREGRCPCRAEWVVGDADVDVEVLLTNRKESISESGRGVTSFASCVGGDITSGE
jgi:uncharacterized phage protein gp47/JayE